MYREPAEIAAEIPASPKPRRFWPIWAWPLTWSLASFLGAGFAVDGCAQTQWHGAFAGLTVACLVFAGAGIVVAINRAEAINKK